MPTPAPLCTHVKPSGATCGSPAVSGTALCYHHSTVKTTLAKVVPLDQVPYGAHSPLPFVFPEDRVSLQINLFLLLKAFNEKRIDQRTATIMHRMLRSMSATLGAKPLTEDRAEATAAPTSAPTSATSPAPVADPIKPSCSDKIAGDVSPRHEQPEPNSKIKVQKSAPGSAPGMVTGTSQHSLLPPSSHNSIDPASVFSAVYPRRNAPAYPLNQTGREQMGVLSPEGQRILSMFGSQRD
jgi:hypothetical protein